MKFLSFFNIDKKSEKIEIFPEIDANIKLPLNCQSDPFYFEEKFKARAINLFIFKKVIIAAEGFVYKGLSISEESFFHEGLKKTFNKFKFFKRSYFKRRTTQIDKAMLFCDPWSLINYYHWFCDSMMRFSAASEYLSEDLSIIIPYDKHSLNREMIRDSVMAFGVKKENIIWLDKNQKIAVKELLMPSHIVQYGKIFFRKEVLDLLRLKMINFYSSRLTKNCGEKIYISRSKASKRGIANENEVIELLRKYDFSILHMEDYSLVDQISIISKAKYLVSCHGAGLSNALFMKPGGFVVELINENLNRPHFYGLASAASLNYLCYKCKSSNQKEANDSVDIVVDVSSLQEGLQKIIS